MEAGNCDVDVSFQNYDFHPTQYCLKYVVCVRISQIIPGASVAGVAALLVDGGGWGLHNFFSALSPQSQRETASASTGSNCICELSCPELPPCVCPAPVIEVCHVQPLAASLLPLLLSLVAVFACGWYFGQRGRAARATETVSRHEPVALDTVPCVAALTSDLFDVPFIPASRQSRPRKQSLDRVCGIGGVSSQDLVLSVRMAISTRRA